jgi:hypothetical protein
MKSFTHERFSITFQVACLILLLGYGISKSDDESIIVSRKHEVIQASELNALPMTANEYLLAQYQTRNSRELLAQKKRFRFLNLFTESPMKKNRVYGKNKVNTWFTDEYI